LVERGRPPSGRPFLCAACGARMTTAFRARAWDAAASCQVPLRFETMV
jgi:hypothetical protein